MDLDVKNIYGLIGKNIAYSFSREYFTKKFKDSGDSQSQYLNFDLQNIDELPLILNEHIEKLRGMNVTIPYKEQVFKYLDETDETATEIGAVNTIKIFDKFKLKGYNTDYYGFEHSIQPFLKRQHSKALILGTGGASKAVAFVLKKLNIEFRFVSRKAKGNSILSYKDLNEDQIKIHRIIINCTPVGTHPDIDLCPAIPYQFLTSDHLLYDLIYNPRETLFLKKGKEKGAAIKNGLEMLQLQAEEAWRIWNS